MACFSLGVNGFPPFPELTDKPKLLSPLPEELSGVLPLLFELLVLSELLLSFFSACSSSPFSPFSPFSFSALCSVSDAASFSVCFAASFSVCFAASFSIIGAASSPTSSAATSDIIIKLYYY